MNRRRLSNGRFAKSLSRFVPIYMLAFTVSIGLPGYYKDTALVQRFLTSTTAVASDLPAGQRNVQNEIVNSSEVRVDDANPQGEVKTTPAPTIAPDDMSVYISQAVQEFLPDHKSEGLMIMHCLAHRENGHAANRSCGDSGRACGPFQFWQPTWEGMRKLMIKEGKATEIGDRYDKKESARTTAWALADGREMNWGPIVRASKGSDYAACPVPSWSKSK